MATTTPVLTIWHNTVGRPIPCVGLPNGYEGRSGISPFSVDTPKRTAEAVAEFVRTIDRYGAAILVDSRTDRPANHHLIGCGGGHDDADWAESRFEQGSQVAWYENDSTWHDPAEIIARRATKGDR